LHFFTSSTTFSPLRFFILLLIVMPLLVIGRANGSAMSGNSQEIAAFTPPAGSALRKAILDGLRRELMQQHGLQVVFVIDTLLVKDDWAWVDSRPQSPDGLHNYEDVSALLHLERGNWQVVEIPCTEEDNPDCRSDAGYVARLQQRFPAAPLALILPQVSTRSN